jgi:hypothetical protein
MIEEYHPGKGNTNGFSFRVVTYPAKNDTVAFDILPIESKSRSDMDTSKARTSDTYWIQDGYSSSWTEPFNILLHVLVATR